MKRYLLILIAFLMIGSLSFAGLIITKGGRNQAVTIGGDLLSIVGGCRTITESLDFDAQVGTFTATNTITGAKSGATATISSVIDNGTSGTLNLADVVGTFQDNEIIFESALGAELITVAADREFTADTGFWTLHANTDINVTTANKCHAAAVPTNDIIMNRNALLTIGTYIQSICTVSGRTGGALEIWAGTVSQSYHQADGTFTDYLAVSDTALRYNARTSNATLDIDDVSIKVVTNAALADGTVY